MNAPQKTDAPVAIDEGGRGVQIALTVVLMIVAISAFVLGALPLISIASEWARLPTGVAVLLPVVLDAGAVAAALAAIVRHSRGQRATLETALLLLTVVVSVAAQVVHAWQIGDGTWEARTITIAAALGSAPIIVLLASHAAIRTLTPPRQKGRTVRRTAVASKLVAVQVGQAAKPAAPKPAAKVKAGTATTPKPASSNDLPVREPGEDDVTYAVRLVSAGVSQRNAATIASTTRSKIETRLKQIAAAEASSESTRVLAA